MIATILITGSNGLVGTSVRAALEARGARVVGMDLLGTHTERGDVRDAALVTAALGGCCGVVHLAAVSRVVWAERDPRGCWDTNVLGLRNVIDAAEGHEHRPWLIFASSREVYGQSDHLPASEDAPLRPVNAYGRSKVEGERIVCSARSRGLRAAIVRLSNVYGSTADHADRVIPAFARASVFGSPLRVEGNDHTFDFTHVDDTTNGIIRLIDLLSADRDAPPPIQLLTGQPTKLGELASLAVELAGRDAAITQEEPRSYDVSKFYGSPARARQLLDWTPRVALREGLGRLIDDFRAESDDSQYAEVAS